MCFAIVSFTPPEEEYYGMLVEMDARRRGSSGGEVGDKLSTDPEEVRNWILLSGRPEMISPPLVDLDVFGQRLFWRHLHVRRPVVPLAHSCVRMTWYLEWQRVLLFPDIFALNWAQWRRIKSVGRPSGLRQSRWFC